MGILKKTDGSDWTDEEMGLVALETGDIVIRQGEDANSVKVNDDFNLENLKKMLKGVDFEYIPGK